MAAGARRGANDCESVFITFLPDHSVIDSVNPEAGNGAS